MVMKFQIFIENVKFLKIEKFNNFVQKINLRSVLELNIHRVLRCAQYSNCWVAELRYEWLTCDKVAIANSRRLGFALPKNLWNVLICNIIKIFVGSLKI